MPEKEGSKQSNKKKLKNKKVQNKPTSGDHDQSNNTGDGPSVTEGNVSSNKVGDGPSTSKEGVQLQAGSSPDKQKDTNKPKTEPDEAAERTVIGAEKTETTGSPDTSPGDAKQDKDPDSSSGEAGKPGKQAVEEESEDEGIDDIFPSEDMDRATRDALYERGVQYETKKKPKPALKCYLQCLKGLSDVTKFSFLPQCLRKVADIYFEMEELEKAIQFIQAEKMYYETALIDTTELEKKLEVRKKNTKEGSTDDPKQDTPDIVRADEYENLARLCLEQKQPQLALEYQGKATKLRQQTYGENHPVTTKSLDFFTVIYGEVGKQQYSESMEKIKQKGQTADNGSEGKSDPDSPQSILRRRKNAKPDKQGENKDDKKKHVRFAQSALSQEDEVWISHSILAVLFVLCLVMLVSILFYLYCKVDTDSRLCVTWKTEIWYYYMRIKYMYHYYFASKKDEVVG